MECLLGIETSCDETAAAVVDSAGCVRSNIVASQYDLHARYGGVVPEIASRAHLERMLPVMHSALEQAGIGIEQVAAIAVGIRPGLIGSLLVGTSAAKALAFSRGIPFYAVDHVAAHLFAGLLRERDATAEVEHDCFPALGLVVSGGHTSLFRVMSPIACELIGRTIDDAVGEAFDKAAVMLGLPHPGGPNLERCATTGNARALEFSKPQLPNPLDFSLSGLKTKMLYAVRGVPQGRGGQTVFARTSADLTSERRADLAASFQRGAIAQVLDRLSRAAEMHASRTLFVGGGVVSNQALRRELQAWSLERGVTLIAPQPRFCVDNAAMIALHAVLRRSLGDAGDDLSIAAQPVSLLARGASAKRIQ